MTNMLYPPPIADSYEKLFWEWEGTRGMNDDKRERARPSPLLPQSRPQRRLLDEFALLRLFLLRVAPRALLFFCLAA